MFCCPLQLKIHRLQVSKINVTNTNSRCFSFGQTRHTATTGVSNVTVIDLAHCHCMQLFKAGPKPQGPSLDYNLQSRRTSALRFVIMNVIQSPTAPLPAFVFVSGPAGRKPKESTQQHQLCILLRREQTLTAAGSWLDLKSTTAREIAGANCRKYRTKGARCLQRQRLSQSKRA